MSQQENEEIVEEEKTVVSPNPVEKLIQDVSTPLGGLLASSSALLAGIGLLADDAGDFGDLSTPEHPSPFHHWLWGSLLMIGGAAGMGFNLLRLIQENPPPPRMPKSMVEGMPLRDLKRFM